MPPPLPSDRVIYPGPVVMVGRVSGADAADQATHAARLDPNLLNQLEPTGSTVGDALAALGTAVGAPSAATAADVGLSAYSPKAGSSRHPP